MSGKYNGKYRRKTIRLQTWDYGGKASYFITIYAKWRKHYFGEIDNGKLQISPAGTNAFVLWFEIKNHTKNVELGEFIVMLDHVHGILILNGVNLIG
jgi:REP element-mobilizing transposase RayT